MDNSLDIKIDKICRACLGIKGTMKPIYGALLDEMFMSLTCLQVAKNDGLPELMCVQCILLTSRAYTFKRMCEKSDATLRAYVTSLPIDNTTQTCNNSKLETFSDSQTGDNSEFKVALREHNYNKAPNDHDYDVKDTNLSCFSNAVKQELDTNVSEEEASRPASPTSSSDHKTSDHKLSTPSKNIVPLKLRKRKNTKNSNVTDSKSDLKKLIKSSKTASVPGAIDKKIKKNIHNHNSLKKALIKCKFCFRKFEDTYDLTVHSQNCKPNIKCELCNKMLYNRAYARHMKTHMSVKPFQCDICKKTFVEKSNMAKHIKTHTGELRNLEGKPYLCSVCGRAFKWYSSLSKHFKYHTGRKLFKCPHCPKQYTEMRPLRVHLLLHTGERPYKCDVCNATFVQQANLDKHRRGHSRGKPYLCEVCGKGFTQKEYVALHMRIHTGEKPFECKLCSKRFTLKSMRKTHQRVHDPARPFGCFGCGYRFKRYPTLATHALRYCKKMVPFYHCANCEIVFPSEASLAAHMESAHPPPPPEPAAEELPVTSEPVLPVDSTLKPSKKQKNEYQYLVCPYNTCGLTLPSIPTMKLHIKEHLKADELIKKQKLKERRELFLTEDQEKVAESYQCGECNIFCATPQSFITHFSTHISKEMCKKLTIQRDTVTLGNQSNIGPDGRPREKVTQETVFESYQCSECENLFSEAHHFIAHYSTHVNKDMLCRKLVIIQGPPQAPIETRAPPSPPHIIYLDPKDVNVRRQI